MGHTHRGHWHRLLCTHTHYLNTSNTGSQLSSWLVEVCFHCWKHTCASPASQMQDYLQMPKYRHNPSAHLVSWPLHLLRGSFTCQLVQLDGLNKHSHTQAMGTLCLLHCALARCLPFRQKMGFSSFKETKGRQRCLGVSSQSLLLD